MEKVTQDISYILDNESCEPFLLVIFGASGDLTKRLLIPALYNLACDGLLGENFSLLGVAQDKLSSKAFRENMTSSINAFQTREKFDPTVWEQLVKCFHYVSGTFDDADFFKTLCVEIDKLEKKYNTKSNILFYLATDPRFFGIISKHLYNAGLQKGSGWRRIIIEKPFGTDLNSALALNREILTYWPEDQIYRIDHYLGKETVQNLLVFRFLNGMFEPIWNNNYIDNIQFNVAEQIDVENRGAYYERTGVLKDMMQNHMLQVLAYLCMEAPYAFVSEAIRDEKAKLLENIRIYNEEEVKKYIVRGQYGPEVDEQGNIIKPGYRQAEHVNFQSNTETYIAARFQIDNPRWDGVPIYLRSGKALWKRGTEIIVEFKKKFSHLLRDASLPSSAPNRLIFHIQPYQGIEIQFQAKMPGLNLKLQPVRMRFGYEDAFKVSRYTGYETMIYNCNHGDASLFTRNDMVEAAWRVVQPIIDYWKKDTLTHFPTYLRETWGPKAGSELIARDNRQWYEIVSEDILRKVTFFKDSESFFLSKVIMCLDFKQLAEGEVLFRRGEIGKEMYIIARGEVDVIRENKILATLKDGQIFGEIAILFEISRTTDVVAKTNCDLFILEKHNFLRILNEHPNIAEEITRAARKNLNQIVDMLLPKRS